MYVLVKHTDIVNIQSACFSSNCVRKSKYLFWLFFFMLRLDTFLLRLIVTGYWYSVLLFCFVLGGGGLGGGGSSFLLKIWFSYLPYDGSSKIKRRYFTLTLSLISKYQTKQRHTKCSSYRKEEITGISYRKSINFVSSRVYHAKGHLVP